MRLRMAMRVRHLWMLLLIARQVTGQGTAAPDDSDVAAVAKALAKVEQLNVDLAPLDRRTFAALFRSSSFASLYRGTANRVTIPLRTDRGQERVRFGGPGETPGAWARRDDPRNVGQWQFAEREAGPLSVRPEALEAEARTFLARALLHDRDGGPGVSLRLVNQTASTVRLRVHWQPADEDDELRGPKIHADVWSGGWVGDGPPTAVPVHEPWTGVLAFTAIGETVVIVDAGRSSAAYVCRERSPFWRGGVSWDSSYLVVEPTHFSVLPEPGHGSVAFTPVLRASIDGVPYRNPRGGMAKGEWTPGPQRLGAERGDRRWRWLPIQRQAGVRASARILLRGLDRSSVVEIECVPEHGGARRLARYGDRDEPGWSSEALQPFVEQLPTAGLAPTPCRIALSSLVDSPNDDLDRQSWYAAFELDGSKVLVRFEVHARLAHDAEVIYPEREGARFTWAMEDHVGSKASVVRVEVLDVDTTRIRQGFGPPVRSERVEARVLEAHWTGPVGHFLGREPRDDLRPGATVKLLNKPEGRSDDLPLGLMQRGQTHWVAIAPSVHGWSPLLLVEPAKRD